MCLTYELGGKIKVRVEIIEIKNKERLEVFNKNNINDKDNNNNVKDEKNGQTVGNIGLEKRGKIQNSRKKNVDIPT